VKFGPVYEVSCVRLKRKLLQPFPLADPRAVGNSRDMIPSSDQHVVDGLVADGRHRWAQLFHMGYETLRWTARQRWLGRAHIAAVLKVRRREINVPLVAAALALPQVDAHPTAGTADDPDVGGGGPR
jgi:hypothetical protein